MIDQSHLAPGASPTPDCARRLLGAPAGAAPWLAHVHKRRGTKPRTPVAGKDTEREDPRQLAAPPAFRPTAVNRPVDLATLPNRPAGE
jgi:hypothetical protein